MSRKAILVAICSFAASAAWSQVTNVDTSRSVSVSDLYDGLNVSQSVSDSAAQYSFPNGASPFFQAIENYQVSADVTATDITFANNVTSQGFVASTTSSTVVAVTFINTGSNPVNATLESTILPGGFGFFLDSPQDNPTLSGTAIGDVNQTPGSRVATFNNISGYVPLGPGGSEGYAGFTFDILQDGTPVASYAGNVSLYLSNAAVGANFTVSPSAAPALNGFSLITAPGSNQAVAYQWDTTEVAIPLGVLAPQQSTTLTYETTVTAGTFVQNGNNCPTQNVCPQLLAYSGFGDPIRTSAGGGLDPYFPTFDLSLPTFDPVTGVAGSGKIKGVGPSLTLPGVPPATFTAIPASILAPAPEPASWALMITGIAGIGRALRGRGRPARA